MDEKRQETFVSPGYFCFNVSAVFACSAVNLCR